jgi:hypothetical protein
MPQSQAQVSWSAPLDTGSGHSNDHDVLLYDITLFIFDENLGGGVAPRTVTVSVEGNVFYWKGRLEYADSADGMIKCSVAAVNSEGQGLAAAFGPVNLYPQLRDASVKMFESPHSTTGRDIRREIQAGEAVLAGDNSCLY